MKFRDLFEDIEDWFWKLEFNPETSSYELYLGIPNDWVYPKETDEPIIIESIHELESNSIIKIFATVEEVTIDDILEFSKNMISKNKELEKRKDEHKAEMERLRDELLQKEIKFLNYVDSVKEIAPTTNTKPKIEEVKVETPVENANVSLITNDTSELEIKGQNFIDDIEKLNLK